MTRQEAREELKKAGIGSRVKKLNYPGRSHKDEEGEITGFDSDGDPEIKYDGESISVAEFAVHVTLVKAANSNTAGSQSSKPGYPPVGSKWKRDNDELIVTAHDRDQSGRRCPNSVQFRYTNGRRTCTGDLDSISVAAFAKGLYTPVDIRNSIGAACNAPTSKKKTNGNREHCYSCGSLTEILDTGIPASRMRVCPKCKV